MYVFQPCSALSKLSELLLQIRGLLGLHIKPLESASKFQQNKTKTTLIYSWILMSLQINLGKPDALKLGVLQSVSMEYLLI